MQNLIKLTSSGRLTLILTLIVLAPLAAPMVVHAQGRRAGQGAGQGGVPRSPEAGAPIDLTGYWESLVTFDWEIRMVTPRPGDYAGVPLKPAGVQIMDAWDPAKDMAMGLQCKSYGAAGLMRLPGHLHITWQDEQTMKMETDAGQQTRLLHFVNSDAEAHGPKTLQGYSAAEWNLQRVGSGGQPGSDVFRPGRTAWGSLEVTTTNLQAGYLRKNGVPYSEDATLLEYYDLVDEGNGQWLMVVTSVVKDPAYLFIPYITTSQFLKQPSDADWAPSACSATW